MDENQLQDFILVNTHRLNELSPLILPQKPSLYARMPIIFKNPDLSENNSVQQLDDIDGISQSTTPMENMAKLVEAGGSEAYFLYLAQMENMELRNNIEESKGIFNANI